MTNGTTISSRNSVAIKTGLGSPTTAIEINRPIPPAAATSRTTRVTRARSAGLNNVHTSVSPAASQKKLTNRYSLSMLGVVGPPPGATVGPPIMASSPVPIGDDGEHCQDDDHRALHAFSVRAASVSRAA